MISTHETLSNERHEGGTTENKKQAFASPALTMTNAGIRGTRNVGAALLAIWLLTGCASPHTDSLEITQERKQAEIQQRLQDVFAAAEAKDFDRLDSYHLYGPKFTKFAASSPDRLDAAAGRKGEHDGLGPAKDLKMRAEALKIDVFGNVGIATFILDYSFNSGAQTLHKKDRSTLIFVKENGAWKISHEHLSPINP